MKPKHNRVMCPECFREKMLFETQKQADNFIKWNGDDIDTDGGELRSYYCPACGGYHITSKPFKPSYKHNTENLIKRYKNDLKIQQDLKEVKTTEKFPEANKVFAQLIEEVPAFANPSRKFIKDFITSFLKVNKIALSHGEEGELRRVSYKYYLNK